MNAKRVLLLLLLLSCLLQPTSGDTIEVERTDMERWFQNSITLEENYKMLETSSISSELQIVSLRRLYGIEMIASWKEKILLQASFLRYVTIGTQLEKADESIMRISGEWANTLESQKRLKTAILILGTIAVIETVVIIFDTR